jgi:exosortase
LVGGGEILGSDDSFEAPLDSRDLTGKEDVVSRTTFRNLSWAVFVGVVFTLSPVSGGRIETSILPGLAVAAATFGYRAIRKPRSGDPVPAPAESPPAFVKPPLLLWINLLLFCIVFAPTARWLYQQWSAGIWHNAHGLFVPFVAAYLARSILRRHPRRGPDSSLWGLPFVVAGLSLAVVDSGNQTHYLSTLGLVLCLPGFSLLFLGETRTKALLLPLVLVLFIFPVPNSVAAYFRLPILSALGAELLLDQSGLLFVRHQGAFTLPSATIYYVREGCGGFPTLYAAVAAVLILSVHCKSRLRRLALLLAPLPLTLVVNSFRISSLVLLSEHLGSDILDTPMHAASGIVTFWIVMGMLFLSADRRTLRQDLT